VKPVLQSGFRWKVGTGTHISVWDPFWIQDGHSSPPPPIMTPGILSPNAAQHKSIPSNQSIMFMHPFIENVVDVSRLGC